MVIFVYVIRQVAASLLSLPESIASENLGEVAHFYLSDGAHILLCLCIQELPFLYCFVYGRLCGNSEKRPFVSGRIVVSAFECTCFMKG
nr:Uncharacterised protein [Klebsiella pneumoniae]